MNFTLEESKVLSFSFINLLKLLAPFAPHITEELWEMLSKDTTSGCLSIHLQKWPSFDEKSLVTDEVELVIQMGGKKIDVLKIKKGLPQQEIETMAMNQEKVKIRMEGKTLIKVIVVPDKIVNIVAR